MDVQSLINTLSLEEKCALLSGAETFKSRGMPQHGIPQMWLSDGPHGVRKQAGESDHLGLNPSVPATCFPTASAVANSWDVALGEEIGQALGEEAAAQDVAVLLGPGLNMKRNPLCGRNFEYFSEDPYLAGKLAAVQSSKISESDVDARLKELMPLIFDTRAALDKAPKQFDESTHHELARRAAAESLVLLKNGGSLLPFAEGNKVAVIGDFAETPRYQGAGSSMVNSTKVDTLLDALKTTGLTITGYAQGFDRHGKPDEGLQQGACELAADAQAALVCLGLDEIQESEGLDRSAMKLAQNQVELLPLF